MTLTREDLKREIMERLAELDSSGQGWPEIVFKDGPHDIVLDHGRVIQLREVDDRDTLAAPPDTLYGRHPGTWLACRASRLVSEWLLVLRDERDTKHTNYAERVEGIFAHLVQRSRSLSALETFAARQAAVLRAQRTPEQAARDAERDVIEKEMGLR